MAGGAGGGADRMAAGGLHLVKLCVGAATVQDLLDWHAENHGRWPAGRTIHVTRMWPKRADELLAGGSLYWVFKGLILARQAIMALDPQQGSDGIERCAIVLDARVIRTAPAARQPFQGWRYLVAAEAPPDLPEARAGETALPPSLASALADIGLR
jgi:hypothetical protein